MNANGRKREQIAYPGYITPVLASTLPRLSLWSCWERLRSQSTLPREKLVEQYIGVWWLVQVVLSAIVGATHGSTGFFWLAAGLLPMLRVVDIVQANFNLHIFRSSRDVSQSTAGNVNQSAADRAMSRVIVIAVVNYLELVLAFGLIYAAGGRAGIWHIVKEATTIRDHLYFSAITQLTIGYGDLVPSGPARFVAIVQALIGLAMTVFIFARFSVSLASRDN